MTVLGWFDHQELTWLATNVIGGRPQKYNMSGDKCHGLNMYGNTMGERNVEFKGSSGR